MLPLVFAYLFIVYTSVVFIAYVITIIGGILAFGVTGFLLLLLHAAMDERWQWKARSRILVCVILAPILYISTWYGALHLILFLMHPPQWWVNLISPFAWLAEQIMNFLLSLPSCQEIYTLVHQYVFA